MSRLLIFGRFAHDSQRVLAAIFRFAEVTSKRFANLGTRAMKGGIATLTNGGQWILAHNAHFSGTHDYSLSPNACANETAPLPAAVRN